VPSSGIPLPSCDCNGRVAIVFRTPNGVALGTEKTRYVSSSSDELSMRRLLVGDSEILSESIGKKSAIPGSSRIL